MQPFEFLTLTPAEARLIVAALNGHFRETAMDANSELQLVLYDSCGPDAEGDRLDTVYGVDDWRSLLARISALTDTQAAAVLDAADAFWAGDLDLYTDEALQQVGLL